MKCSKCQSNSVLVNLKYQLCDDCNFFRLNGETKQEKYQRKSKENQLKKQDKVTNSVIKKQLVTVKENHPINSFRFFSNNRDEEYEGKRIKILNIEVEGLHKAYEVRILETGETLICTERDIVKKLPIQN